MDGWSDGEPRRGIGECMATMGNWQKPEEELDFKSGGWMLSQCEPSRTVLTAFIAERTAKRNSYFKHLQIGNIEM